MKKATKKSTIYSITDGIDLGKGKAYLPFDNNSKSHIDKICKKWGYQGGDYLDVFSNIYSNSKIYKFNKKKPVIVDGNKTDSFVNSFVCHEEIYNKTTGTIKPVLNIRSNSIDFYWKFLAEVDSTGGNRTSKIEIAGFQFSIVWNKRNNSQSINQNNHFFDKDAVFFQSGMGHGNDLQSNVSDKKWPSIIPSKYWISNNDKGDCLGVDMRSVTTFAPKNGYLFSIKFKDDYQRIFSDNNITDFCVTKIILSDRMAKQVKGVDLKDSCYRVQSLPVPNNAICRGFDCSQCRYMTAPVSNVSINYELCDRCCTSYGVLENA